LLFKIIRTTAVHIHSNNKYNKILSKHLVLFTIEASASTIARCRVVACAPAERLVLAEKSVLAHALSAV